MFAEEKMSDSEPEFLNVANEANTQTLKSENGFKTTISLEQKCRIKCLLEKTQKMLIQTAISECFS